MASFLGNYDENADDGSGPPTNVNPYSRAMGAEQARGASSWLDNRLNNPLVQFGLGLASGKTPQEGFGNALQAQLARQKLEKENHPTSVKEFQFAVQN